MDHMWAANRAHWESKCPAFCADLPSGLGGEIVQHCNLGSADWSRQLPVLICYMYIAARTVRRARTEGWIISGSLISKCLTIEGELELSNQWGGNPGAVEFSGREF